MSTQIAAEVFPPGEFLRDELEARNWSQTEFAEIIGRPVRLVNEIIAGKRAITPETARQLEASLGTSAELWMNLESQYQLSKVRGNGGEIQRKARLYERFPVREMARRGWIDPSDKPEVLEHEFLRYFEIQTIDDEPRLAHAAKRSAGGDAVPLQVAWLFRVKKIAQSFVVPRYRAGALREALADLRQLMTAPEEVRRVPKILNDAGVRFVIVEALQGSKIDGACMWLRADQPVIALSARLDRIDNFWFVLRHEIEHVLHEHGKSSSVILDEALTDGECVITAREELMANAAASEFGVTDAELGSYMSRVNPYFFSRDRVNGFAARVGVHPGIVVGRLQRKLKDSNYPDPYKYLREYLVKVRHLVSNSAPTDGWGNVFPIA